MEDVHKLEKVRRRGQSARPYPYRLRPMMFQRPDRKARKRLLESERARLRRKHIFRRPVLLQSENTTSSSLSKGTGDSQGKPAPLVSLTTVQAFLLTCFR